MSILQILRISALQLLHAKPASRYLYSLNCGLDVSVTLYSSGSQKVVFAPMVQWSFFLDGEA